jgi:gas vesicle protein
MFNFFIGLTLGANIGLIAALTLINQGGDDE